MKIKDRKTGKVIKEEEDSASIIKFLYHSLLGRAVLKFIFSRIYFSKLLSIYYKSALSKKKIRDFVKKYDLDKGLLNKDFKSFDDFFKRKEDVVADSEGFVAAASGKIRVFKIGEDKGLYLGDKKLKIMIKGNVYNIDKLLKEPLPEWAKGGYLLLYRLSLCDYHRYIYPTDGCLVRRKNIAGRLESVRRDAAYWRAFAENKREVEYWHTAFGDIIHMEIGAMLVGHIHNHRKRSFKRGDEKGYFSYGGSSIVEIVGKGIEIDGDILKDSERGFETKIKIGERIGYGSNKAT